MSCVPLGRHCKGTAFLDIRKSYELIIVRKHLFVDLYQNVLTEIKAFCHFYTID